MSSNNFNTQDVVSIAAALLGAQPADLIDKIGESDFTNTEQLTSFLKPFAVKKFNNLRDEALNKGFRQASKRMEKLWAEVFNEDISGQKLEDLFINHREKLSAQKSDKSNITLQKALQSSEVKNYIEQLKKTASEADQIRADFDKYKTLQSIKAEALNVLNSSGANFSENKAIKARQMAALEAELKNLKFNRNPNGEITLLDDTGEPLFNKETAQNWNFSDYVKTLSPVDFSQPPAKKQNKNTFVPNIKGDTGNAYGFTQSQIKTFTYEDFKQVLNEGDTEKAKFIQEQMLLNHEQNLNK
tara:strand:+ start:5482 stop:6381 length:900 start_codon:yes stop_codon:yes gene_type:complete